VFATRRMYEVRAPNCSFHIVTTFAHGIQAPLWLARVSAYFRPNLDHWRVGAHVRPDQAATRPAGLLGRAFGAVKQAVWVTGPLGVPEG
jgi:hypothetical protein